MNKEQWHELKDKFLGREKELAKYVFEMDPDDIVDFDQARVKGNMVENISKYEAQFIHGVPQHAPISVILNVNGKTATCMDGTTRAKAKQRAKKVQPNQKILVSTYHHVVEGFNHDDWDDFQDQANDHDGAQPATDEDMKARLWERVGSGRLQQVLQQRLGNSYPDTSTHEGLKEFVKEAGIWAKETLFKNSSRTALWFENKILEAVNQKSSGPTKMVTRTTEEALQFYTNYGGTNYTNTGGDVKIISNGEKVAEVVGSSRIANWSVGSLCTYAANLGEAEGLFTLILNYTTTELKGLNAEKLNKKREQDTSTFLSRRNLFSPSGLKVRVVALPQVSQDKGLIKVFHDETKGIVFSPSELKEEGNVQKQLSLVV